MGETIGFKSCCLFWLFGRATVHYPSNYATLHWSGYSTDFTTHTPETPSFFDLREFAGFLRVFCAEFQVWRFPVLQICRPKAIIPNSE